MEIHITKDDYIGQLGNMGYRYQQPEIIAQAVGDWDSLTNSAQSATLFIRGYNDAFDCHMASAQETGFFNTYLPISDGFLSRK